ncbi:hypothetical protein Kpho02_01220 [Kitasatospora phosalacinea]|uniref:Uncharacterized protein n=1 Tax=Kitasatospora phosalacinea TaxID=2065 RepID=A0A9W6Q3L9_9ACTN|nr:hypothetical protein Kpho02_01220 [Kitasatospora phosalacinea]
MVATPTPAAVLTSPSGTGAGVNSATVKVPDARMAAMVGRRTDNPAETRGSWARDSWDRDSWDRDSWAQGALSREVGAAGCGAAGGVAPSTQAG